MSGDLFDARDFYDARAERKAERQRQRASDERWRARQRARRPVVIDLDDPDATLPEVIFTPDLFSANPDRRGASSLFSDPGDDPDGLCVICGRNRWGFGFLSEECQSCARATDASIQHLADRPAGDPERDYHPGRHGAHFDRTGYGQI